MGFVHTLSLILTIVGIIIMKRLKFSVNYAKNSLDGKLLLLTFFITVNFLVVAATLCIAYLALRDTDPKQVTYMTAQLASTVLELIQVIAQSYFIHDMFYRCCPHESYLRTKPGSTILIVLSALNFSLWMIYSFQVKHNSVLFQVGLTNFESGGMKYLHTFITTTLPMAMLYRYHSSVCLAISYTRVYEDEVTRYESMLRWVKQGTTNEFLQNQYRNLENTWGSAYDMTLKSSKTKCGQSKSVRPRFSSHPMLRIFTTQTNCLSRWGLRSSDVVKIHSSQSIKRQEKPVRRDTRINLELARIRVAATEMGHRMLEMKLKQQQSKQQRKCEDLNNAHCVRTVANGQCVLTEKTPKRMFIVGYDEDVTEYDSPSLVPYATSRGQSSTSSNGVGTAEMCLETQVNILNSQSRKRQMITNIPLHA
ncbi:unnamed protein product [Dicrocoelium dendriticum]|nr:unnamed protein product [Dicrocoelium dendriticum]